MSAALVGRLETLLQEALEPLGFDAPGQAAWGRAHRLATAVLQREQAAGRIRDFRVACGAAENPPGSEGVTVEVAVVPPGPHVASVAMRVVAR